MKHSHLAISLATVCLVLSMIACGNGESATEEPVIETSAGEINFSAADLGSDWSLMSDQGLDDMPDMKQPHIRDANMRMFGAAAISGMAMSIVFTTDTIVSAEKEMEGGTVQSFADDIQEQVPGAALETLEPPDIGDEATMVGGGHPDLGLNIYFVAFRKANVIVLFSLIGSADSVTEETALDYARKLEAKIQ